MNHMYAENSRSTHIVATDSVPSANASIKYHCYSMVNDICYVESKGMYNSLANHNNNSAYSSSTTTHCPPHYTRITKADKIPKELYNICNPNNGDNNNSKNKQIKNNKKHRNNIKSTSSSKDDGKSKANNIIMLPARVKHYHGAMIAVATASHDNENVDDATMAIATSLPISATLSWHYNSSSNSA